MVAPTGVQLHLGGTPVDRHNPPQPLTICGIDVHLRMHHFLFFHGGHLLPK
jgi:hypothetical protein